MNVSVDALVRPHPDSCRHPEGRPPQSSVVLATVTNSPQDDVQSSRKYHSFPVFARDTLMSFLSRQNLHSSDPTILTANRIMRLYLALDKPHRLGPTRITTLISLFGTLSLCAHLGPNLLARILQGHHEADLTTHPNVRELDDATRRHLLSFASRMEKGSYRLWWGSVLRLVKDKHAMAEKMGWKGHETDHYWLMKARLGLSNVKGIELDACEDSPCSPLSVTLVWFCDADVCIVLRRYE